MLSEDELNNPRCSMTQFMECLIEDHRRMSAAIRSVDPWYEDFHDPPDYVKCQFCDKTHDGSTSTPDRDHQEGCIWMAVQESSKEIA